MQDKTPITQGNPDVARRSQQPRLSPSAPLKPWWHFAVIAALAALGLYGLLVALFTYGWLYSPKWTLIAAGGLFVVALVFVAVILRDPTMWYRRNAGFCLTASVGVAVLPTINAQFVWVGTAGGKVSMDGGSAILAVMLLLVSIVFVWLDFHSRRKVVADTEEGLRLSREKNEICKEVLQLLEQNKVVRKQLGPDSIFLSSEDRVASADKAMRWNRRKTEEIIPNNAKIIELFDKNLRLFSTDEIEKFSRFKEHAKAFEENAVTRLDRDSLPVFPLEFEEMIKKGVDE